MHVHLCMSVCIYVDMSVSMYVCVHMYISMPLYCKNEYIYISLSSKNGNNFKNSLKIFEIVFKNSIFWKNSEENCQKN